MAIFYPIRAKLSFFCD